MSSKPSISSTLSEYCCFACSACLINLIHGFTCCSSGLEYVLCSSYPPDLLPITTCRFVFSPSPCKSRSLYQFSASGSTIASMRINSLPVELAPSHGSSLSLGGGVKGFLTGVRMPAPLRKASLRGAWAAPGISMTINSSCTLLVCFHDPGAATEIRSTASEQEFASQNLLSVPPTMEVPDWAIELGLVKTKMRVSSDGRIARQSPLSIY